MLKLSIMTEEELSHLFGDLDAYIPLHEGKLSCWALLICKTFLVKYSKLQLEFHVVPQDLTCSHRHHLYHFVHPSLKHSQTFTVKAQSKNGTIWSGFRGVSTL